MRQIITPLKVHIRTNIFDQMTISRLQVVAPTKKCLRKSLQRTGAMAAFLKRNYRPKNHEYRYIGLSGDFFPGATQQV